jgi:hypothetical protein
MRLENHGRSTVQLDAESLHLVTADLASLGPGAVVPPAPAPMAPGSGETYEIHFELPAGKGVADYDFSGLNFEWTVRFDDRRAVTGASFQRYAPPRDVYIYDPYPYGFAYPNCWRAGGGVRIGNFSED